MKTKFKNKIRKSTKYIIVFVSIILLIFSFSNFAKELQQENMKTSTKQIYKYTNKFNYDYKVNLISNKYMTTEEIEDRNLVYVTDLIDNIKLDLNYEYQADKRSDIKYTYSVDGKMQAVYTKNGEEQKIWEKDENILKEKTLDLKSDNIEINEKIKLDLKDKNKLLNNFKQQLGMTIEAKYTVTLRVKTSTIIEGKEIENETTPILNIDLAEKTTKITGENNTENTEFISKEYRVAEDSNIIKMVFDCIIALIALILLRYALRSEIMHTVRNEYRQELNRILRICQDKIVQVNTKPIDDGQEVVIVKDFNEIIKVSDELFKPILYFSEKNKEEAMFSVMSEKTCYRYILKK